MPYKPEDDNNNNNIITNTEIKIYLINHQIKLT